ncbi:hypothetical protein [Pseudomonas sp. H3_C08]
MSEDLPMSSYVTSYFLDKEPLPRLGLIAASTGEYAKLNKVWVAGGECYLLNDSEFASFLKTKSEPVNVRGIAINHKVVKMTEPRVELPKPILDSLDK